MKQTAKSEANAQKTVNLLRGIEHGWTPTGKPARKAVKKKIKIPVKRPKKKSRGK